MRSAIIVALLAICATAAAAPGSPEKGQLEYRIGGTWNFENTVNGSNGSEIIFRDRAGIILGVDYFVFDKLSVGFDMAWYRPSYEATIVPEDNSGDVTVNYTASIFNGQFNGTYNFLDTALTPFVEAGLGWTHIDSNVADGPPTTGCWWDPWWGYVCSSWYSSYSDNSFSYFAGAGLRWDINYDMSLKAAYRWMEIDTAASKPQMGSARLELVFHF